MKLIKINTDHYVILDDSEIKEGDWCLMFDDFGNLFLGNQPKQYLGEKAGHYLNKGLKKVTHSTQPYKGMENVTFISPREVKELIGEVGVEKKAEKHAQKMWGEYVGDVFTHNDIITDKTLGENTIYDFKSGYNQALEDNKEKKYTLEDMIKVIDRARNYNDGWVETEDEIIQSLQLKTEWEVYFDENGKLCKSI